MINIEVNDLQSNPSGFEYLEDLVNWLNDEVYEPHLKELQKRIFKVGIVWGVTAILLFTTKLKITYAQFNLPKIGEIGFSLPYLVFNIKDSISTTVFHAIRTDLLGESIKLKMLDVLDPFAANLYTVGFLATIITMPYIVYHLGKYASEGMPGDEEKRLAIYSIPVGALFSVGVVFGYFVFLPFALPYLIGWAEPMGATKALVIDRFLNFVVYSLGSMGLLFELPMFQLLLVRLNIVSSSVYKEKAYLAIVIIAFLSSFITPGDLISFGLVFAPMMGLYFVGYVISKLFGGEK